MQPSPRLSVQPDLAPKADELTQIRDGLMAFNTSQAGPAAVARFAVYLRDDAGTIRGGLVGFFAWRWMSVDWLWVAEDLRRQGYGSELLLAAEKLARGAGCVGAKLDTYEFQARPFYERHGYSVFGVLEGYPANTRTYYLHKSL